MADRCLAPVAGGGIERWGRLGRLRFFRLIAQSEIPWLPDGGVQHPLSRPQPSLLERWLGVKHGHTWTRVIQFSEPVPVSLFPPPRWGRARVGVKASDVPQPCFSPI